VPPDRSSISPRFRTARVGPTLHRFGIISECGKVCGTCRCISPDPRLEADVTLVRARVGASGDGHGRVTRPLRSGGGDRGVATKKLLPA
jgi:hypothetical protein